MKKIKFNLFLALIFISYACQKNYLVKTKVEKFNYVDTKFREQSDSFVIKKSNLAITFSGGGSRSAALTTGQLRALSSIEFINKTKYISCVSGGAWASICYTFCSDMMEDSKLLGKYISSDELTYQDLKTYDDSSIVGCVANSKILGSYVKGALVHKHDELFSLILNSVFLKPLGIGDNRYFTYNEDSKKEIISRNKSLNKEVFYLAKKDRPYLIVNGTIVGNARNTQKLNSLHFEITPLYSGVTSYSINKKKFIRGTYPVGGGYYETFACDSKFKNRKLSEEKANNEEGNVPENDIMYANVKLKKRFRFTLSDAMAITGYAPGTVLAKNRLRFISGNIGGPEIRLWSPYQFFDKAKEKLHSSEYVMADGGNMDNLGLIPLLKRKVENIIVFVNSKQPVEKNKDGRIIVDPALDRVFGVQGENKSDIATNLLSNENAELDTLRNILYYLKSTDRPMIVVKTYIVNNNPDLGVIANSNEKVRVMWVYNDNFENLYVRSGKLKPEIINEYYFKRFDCMGSKFPHLPTFLTSGKGRAIDYELEWANLLAHFGSWVVMDNKEEFLKFAEQAKNTK